MSESRLPTRLVVSAILRQVSADGGTGVILAKGDPDAGSYVLLLRDRGGTLKLVERQPSADFSFKWQVTREETAENEREIYEYCNRRRDQDADLWLVELQIDNAERFVAELRP